MSASEPTGPTKPPFTERLSRLGWLLVCFQLGIVVAIWELPPTGLFRDALTAFGAMRAQAAMLDDDLPRTLWQPVRTPERGLVRSDEAAAFDGLTLYTSGHEAAAILVDMDGHEVHRWEVPFSRVWPPGEQGDRRLDDRFVFIRRAHAEPDGDLLALYETPVDTPNGRGLAKLDRDGKVLWRYDGRTHHDFDVDSAGHVHVLAHRLTDVPGVGPFIEDLVVTLDENGLEVRVLSVLEMLLESPFSRPQLALGDTKGDALHTNTVHVVPPGFAERHEDVTAGDLMICLRNLDLVLVVNPDEERIVWGTTGPWNRPHDPDPLPNGNVLIFDNYAVDGVSHGSAVREYDPIEQRVVWSFDGAELRSDVRSCQQLLPNGNVLITESDGGRLLEVTREGRVAWEFVNPVRAESERSGGNVTMVPIACGGRRYERGELPFLRPVAR